MKYIAVVIAMFALTGCEREQLPTHALMDAEQTRLALAQRAVEVKTVSGSGALELQQPNGDHVRLELAVAFKPPDQGRLRAWKFGQAVFDLTIRGDDVWLELKRDDKAANERISATARQIAQVWRLLNGSLFSAPHLRAELRGNQLRLERRVAKEPTIICFANRDTLTPREYELLDDAGRTKFSLKLDRYRVFGDVVWPMRMIATSESGRIIVDLREVDLNSELPPAALKPPRRAEKLP